MPFIVEETRQIADLRMIGEGLRFKVVIGIGVEIIEFLRCPQRKMRADKRHKGRPRPFGISPCGDPVGGGGGDGEVIVSVAAASGAAVGGKFRRRVIGRRIFAQQGRHPADAADDMHRQNLLAEPVVILAAAEMQLADRHHLVPGIAHPVHPCGGRPVIGGGAVPEPGAVDMVAAGQRRTCRNAHR